MAGKFALTRFANNIIHQNVAEENYSVSVRTAFGGRTARATTNKFDNDSLKRVVQSSESLAKVQHPDPDLLPMPTRARAPSPAQARSQPAFRRNRGLTPALRADAVKKIVSVADQHKLTTAGIFSSSESVEGIFNSRGLHDWHAQTSSEISITMLARRFFGMAESKLARRKPARSRRARRNFGTQSARVCQSARNPSGQVHRHSGARGGARHVGFMFWDFGGLSDPRPAFVPEQPRRHQIFGANINIWDDVAHPLQSGTPFDGEGMFRQRVQLVENGVVKRLVYARATAEKMKKSEYKDKVGPVAPTGHGFSLPNEMGEAPMNIVFGTRRTRRRSSR